MQHLDEGTIHAWLDGALSTEEGAAVEAHVAACAECAAAVAEARGLIAASSRVVSALDIVPGGVIPRQAAPVRRRAWYSTTQFRAAAAVLFVAGASMLLVQDRDGRTVEDLSQQVMSTASAETSQAQPGAATDEMASPPAEADARATKPAELPARPQVAGPGPVETRGQGRRETADGAANALKIVQPPPAIVSMPLAEVQGGKVGGAAVGEAQSTVRLRESQTSARAPLAAPMPDNVVVTGVAVASEVADLTVISRDSTPSARRTVFLVEPGVTVSLTESFTTIRANATARQLRAEAAPAVAVSPPPVNQGLPRLSISWTDSVTEHLFTLSGPLPRERLEEIKKQIEARGRVPR